MNNSSKIFLTILLIFLLFDNIVECQTSNHFQGKSEDDSLSLNEIITTIIKNHPSVKEALEALNNADARISYARTGYLPEIDLTANYSNMGPVTKLTIPSMGTFQLFPENNYSAAINYRQVVYDFGRTSQVIDIENKSKMISEQTIEQIKQKLSLAAVNNFYTMAFLQEAMKIKNEQLIALSKHLEYVEKMRSTGSATEYQVLTTKVRISIIESQKVDLKAALTAQNSFLNSLLGNDGNPLHFVKTELTVQIPALSEDSLLSYAFNNRDEILLSEKKTLLAELRYNLIKIQNKPLISFMASGGAKNGYVPHLEEVKPNYVIGLGIKIPFYDGLKTKYNLRQAESAINTQTFETEISKRNVTNEVREAEAYLYAAEKKLSQFELQLVQAQKAYSLAETSFRSGVITNLDLLDANTTVSESRLMLLKAQIDYAASIYKLKAALGERLY